MAIALKPTDHQHHHDWIWLADKLTHYLQVWWRDFRRFYE